MTIAQIIDVGFAPFIMSLSDMLLLFYLSGGNREIIRKTKRWGVWFIIWLSLTILSQLVFSGETNPRANFLAFYILHFVILLFFSDQCMDAPLNYRTYLVILAVLAFDVCLLLVISLSISIFNFDYIDQGTFPTRVIAHIVLLLFKIGVTISIKKVVRKHFFEFGTTFQSFIIMLPAVPYFVLRNYAFFFKIDPFNVPAIIHYLNVLFGISAMTNMIMGEQLSFRIRQNERIQVEKLARRQYNNYLFNLKTMETVNRKYHDLRHIIRGIDAMDSIEEIRSSVKSIENEIQGYELIFNTGNKTMDVILSDRMQEAKEKNIPIHVHADGSEWEIVSDIDLATIFGNAIDNAIESSEKNEDLNARYIDIRTGKVNEMLIARFENQFAHKLEKNQSKFLTTKKDTENHGYGLQSIEMIVEKYSGEMDINIDNGTFTLTVIIPTS